MKKSAILLMIVGIAPFMSSWSFAAASKTATPIAESQAAAATIGSYQRRNGYFSHQVKTANGNRDIEVYIPKGARQREYWISIALPEGVKSNEFVDSAGWFEIADETLACLLIMKPDGSGVWGNVENELDYVNAAINTLASSGTYYSAFGYNYLVGYGKGVSALQLWAANNPLRMISQVYLNAEADAAYDALLAAAGNTQVGATPQPNHMDFAGYKDINDNPVTQKRTFEAQHRKDILIPTWFVGKSSASLIGYWKAVNDCLDTPAADANYGQVYWQDKVNSNAIATSFSDVRTQVAVRTGSVDVQDPRLTRHINQFLTYYSGYDNNSVYGHFITKRLDYAAAIKSGNMLYKDHMWNGTNRVYIVYVPDSVKHKYSLNNPAPVVFATHGAGQTAMVFLEATDIKETAEKYGFIAVTYDLTGNAEYMVDLLKLVKEDCKSFGVAVDESRIYVQGQSAGGGAVANTLAQNALTVEIFAAFGSTSGTQNTAQKNGSELIVPFYAIYGEYDYWPMKLGALVAGEWRGSQNSQNAWTTNTQSYWLNRLLGLTLEQGVLPTSHTLVDGISGRLIAEHTPISLIVNPTATANRYKSYIWSNKEGIPLFVWSQCYGRGHNLVISDTYQLWENWFSKWQRGKEGQTLLYWKDGVGVGTAVKVKQTR
jgi:poly(3-hydroxybutyrate) depolymerase